MLRNPTVPDQGRLLPGGAYRVSRPKIFTPHMLLPISRGMFDRFCMFPVFETLNGSCESLLLAVGTF